MQLCGGNFFVRLHSTSPSQNARCTSHLFLARNQCSDTNVAKECVSLRDSYSSVRLDAKGLPGEAGLCSTTSQNGRVEGSERPFGEGRWRRPGRSQEPSPETRYRSFPTLPEWEGEVGE
jgi:hypothetical protein